MKKKIVTALLVAALITGSTVGGVTLYRNNHQKPVSVYSMSEISEFSFYFGDSTTLEGNVSDGAVQKVTVASSDTVTSVLVNVGDQVKKGDVLMIMDSTSDNLQLESDRLTLEQNKLKLAQSQKDLEKLKQMTPVSEDSGSSDYSEDYDWGEDSEEDIKAVLYSEEVPLDGNAVPYTGSGTEEDPYVFLCTDNVVIRGSFLNRMGGYDYTALEKSESTSNNQSTQNSGSKSDTDADSGTVKKYTGTGVKSCFRLEVRENDSVKGNLKYAWVYNTSCMTGAVSEEEEKSVDNGTIDWKDKSDSSDDSGEDVGAALYSTLDGKSAPYKGSGTESDPYVFLCTDSVTISGTFLNKMGGYEGKKVESQDSSTKEYERKSSGSCFRLEVRDGCTTAGKLLNAWEQNASVMENAVSEDMEVTLVIYSMESTVKNNPAANSDTSTKTDTDSGDSQSETSEDTIGTDTDSQTEQQQSDAESGSGEQQQSGTESGQESESTSSGTDNSQSESSSDNQGSADTNNSSDNTVVSDSTVSSQSTSAKSAGTETTSSAAKTDLIIYSGESLVSLLARTSSASGSSSSSDSSSSGSSSSTSVSQIAESYTADELKKAISEKENEIKSLNLDIRQTELSIKEEEEKIQNSYIKAKMDGTIKTVGDPTNPPNDGSAFLELTGVSGTYVTGYIAESKLDLLNIGDTVTVLNNKNASMATAEVTDISTYPSDSYTGYTSGISSSWYPFSAVITEGEGFETGDSVQISLQQAESDNYLMIDKMFIRDDNGRKYVYVEDQDGTLKKQYVEVGELYFGSYRVKSGLTTDDYVAFPYGKNVKEGAETTEDPYSDLYNS